jgi:hypothetical protein
MEPGFFYSFKPTLAVAASGMPLVPDDFGSDSGVIWGRLNRSDSRAK